MFGLPVHPIFVHFPIAMLSTTFVLVGISHATRDRWSERLIPPFEWIGLGFLPLVVASGVYDAGLEAITSPDWSQPLIWHVVAATTTSALFLVHAMYRRSARHLRPLVDLGLAGLGFWGLIMTGLIAGEMVYG